MTPFLAFAAGTHHDTDTDFGTILLSGGGEWSMKGFGELGQVERDTLEENVAGIAGEIFAVRNAMRTEVAVRDALDNVDLVLTGAQSVIGIPWDEAKERTYNELADIRQVQEVDEADVVARATAEPGGNDLRRTSLSSRIMRALERMMAPPQNGGHNGPGL